MARIKDSSVEAVKAATDIVTLVEGYTRLRKSGSRYTGLCPFHQEKTPSFGVSPERGTFKCFGCGEGGDAIAFVEKKENVDFVGAIEWLGDRFGVRLEYEETSPEQDRLRKRRERLFQLLDRAATFYERYLWESEAGAFAHEHDHEHVNVDDHVNDHGGGPVHVHVNDHGADHGHGGGHGRDRKR